jgi:hypothetical protein
MRRRDRLGPLLSERPIRHQFQPIWTDPTGYFVAQVNRICAWWTSGTPSVNSMSTRSARYSHAGTRFSDHTTSFRIRISQNFHVFYKNCILESFSHDRNNWYSNIFIRYFTSGATIITFKKYCIEHSFHFKCYVNTFYF